MEGSGKVALVTGGSRGIGRAIALRLSRDGVAVVVNYVSSEAAARELAEEVVARGGRAATVRADVAVAAEAEGMVERVLGDFGRLDILVNNAGIISYKAGIASVSVEEWDKVLDVNLRAPFLLCRSLLQGMKDRRYGKIINFSSMAARVGGIEAGLHYAVSKAGLIGLTKTLAKEGGPYQVNVNAVAPGIIVTGPVAKQIGGHEDSYINNIPLKRLGQPQDVANVVLFLASPLSDYVTGLVIDINGGMYMG